MSWYSLRRLTKRRLVRRILDLEIAEPRRLLTADFELVSDINTQTNAYQDPSPIVQVGSTGYFTATTPETGMALFKTNGTASGTVMVLDPSPGPDDFIIDELTNVSGLLFFSAKASATGYELWRSNGTSIGTQIVKDIAAGSTSSNPAYLTNVNGTLFFAANGGNKGQLWKSDGTEAGTVLVKPVSLATGANYPKDLANANGTLYFSASNTTVGREIWKSDGTAAGTVLVSDVATGNLSTSVQKRDSNPTQFTNVGSTVYFTTKPTRIGTADQTFELWRTDGTAAGTQQVATSFAENAFRELINFNGLLHFSFSGALTRVSNNLLQTVRDTNQFGNDGAASLVNVSGTLYFTAISKQGSAGGPVDLGREVFKSDGSFSGTVVLRDINPGAGNSYARELINVNGTLYFTAVAAGNDKSLWKSNGTEAGTVMVKSADAAEYPSFLSNLGGTLFFNARDPNFYSVKHLWKSDGTGPGTVPVRTVESKNSNPSELTNVNGRLLFVATEPDSGTELWSSDGNIASPVADINAGAGSSNPTSLTNVNGTLYFAAYQPATGIELWKSDSTVNGTTLAADIRRGIVSSAPSQLVNIGSTLYFVADNGTQGRELWRLTSRGTAELVKDIRPGLSSSGITGLTVVGTTLYFQANDGTNGPELWKSDGTSAGTSMVKNIRSGALGSEPDNLTVMGSVLFFQAGDGINGRELWRSNGTSSGTFMVRNIHNRSLGIGSYPTELTVVNSTLYFRATDGSTGNELWKSDGTGAGTVRVRDIHAGIGSSYPSDLTNVNGKLYFTAIDSLNDGELWASDGTAAGTLRVRNIGLTSSSFPINLTNVNGLLYFAADDSVNGNELYRSDGTALGTKRIASFVPGFFGGNPKNIIAIGSQVFLSAQDDIHGRELFVQELLQGTPADDVFTVKFSPTGDSVIVTHAANLIQAPEVYGVFPKSLVFEFVGAGGNDSLRIEASSGTDTFTVDNAGISINGARLTALNFDAVTLAGGAGDDIYRFDADVLQPATYRLDESGGGIDTVDFTPTDALVQLNLTFSIEQNINGNLALNLLSGTSFENIIGGQGPDVLVGNGLANVIEGNGGNDTLVGAGGNDTLLGGIGNDTLNGDTGDDVLSGEEGDDRYLLGVAAIEEQDQLIELPDAGSDTLDFNRLPTSVTLNLGLSTPQAVHTGRTLQLNAVDTFENAIGGAVADLLIGSAMGNSLNGAGGDDDLRGGPGDDVYLFDPTLVPEADQITELANAGLDTISFAALDIPVTLNLATLAVQNVHTNRTLRLSSAVTIENAVGGSAGDTLAGNGLANVLIGNGGSDQLSGLGKRDLLIGGMGADILNGGDDEDILIAGYTMHDAVFSNVNTLLSTWTSAQPQIDRITSLRAGVGVPSIALAKEVDVLDDSGDLDSLTGAGSLDWFFRSIDDLITDLNGEVVDET